MLNVPKFGDYVFVTELPEAVERTKPEYPAAARGTGVSGTVMVQALVLADGTVGDTRIVKSIPPLDAAAVSCVRQWKFKPARNNEGPTAVWVGVPIRFEAP
jgi:protein TonB